MSDHLLARGRPCRLFRLLGGDLGVAIHRMCGHVESLRHCFNWLRPTKMASGEGGPCRTVDVQPHAWRHESGQGGRNSVELKEERPAAREHAQPRGRASASASFVFVSSSIRSSVSSSTDGAVIPSRGVALSSREGKAVSIVDSQQQVVVCVAASAEPPVKDCFHVGELKG